MHKKEAPLHHGREVESPELGGLRAKFRRWPDTKCLFFFRCQLAGTVPPSSAGLADDLPR